MQQQELVERAQRGDHAAFEELVGPSFNRLYAIARRILVDSDLADDAVQEGIVRAWRDIRGLKDPGRFDAWLHRLLVRACYDELRRGRRRVEIPILMTDRPSDADATSDVADRDALERGFRRLSVEHRTVLVMHHYLGLEPLEIAETLGMATGTVHSRLHYATRELRSALEADARPGVRKQGGQPA